MSKKISETQLSIKKSFTQLLIEKGFESITVSEITRLAGINRGTFYLHYLDKFDLLEKLQQLVMDEFREILIQPELIKNEKNPIGLIPVDVITRALYFVKSDLLFFQALTMPGSDGDFVNRFKKIVSDLFISRMEETDKITFAKKGISEDYALEIMLSSVTSIVLLWIRKGALETPEYIAQMINLTSQIAPSELLI